MRMDMITVRTILEANRRRLHEEYGVASLALFGSTVRGEAGETSDLDMLVEFSKPVGYFGLVALQEYLAELLGREVDLGTLRALKPRFRPRVEQEMQRVLLSGNAPAG